MTSLVEDDKCPHCGHSLSKFHTTRQGTNICFTGVEVTNHFCNCEYMLDLGEEDISENWRRLYGSGEDGR